MVRIPPSPNAIHVKQEKNEDVLARGVEVEIGMRYNLFSINEPVPQKIPVNDLKSRSANIQSPKRMAQCTG